jgi:serine/threonine-protein kinase SRPK3
MDTHILYDDKKDNLYILIYKLGKGACATVWFAIELFKFIENFKLKKLIIQYKALKIHNSEDYDEGLLEIKIKDILPKNDENSKYINYPLSHFIYNDDIVIVVYNVAIGSLYNLIKMYDNKLPEEFIKKIIPQASKSIEFLHKHNYIHTDIKPENFLLVGLTKFQNDIINFVKNYNLFSKFDIPKKTKINFNNISKLISNPIYKLIDDISIEFDIFDMLIDSDNTSESSNEESDDEESDDEESDDEENNEEINEEKNNEETNKETNEDNNEENNEKTDKSSSVETDISSYNSRRNEYFNKYDKFNIEKILKLENRDTNSEETQNAKLDDENMEFIKQYIENPTILLTDFGFIQEKSKISRTVQTRYYRSPEIILGEKYDEKIDLWALGCTFYELITGIIMINVEKSEYVEKYDKDLINIKLLIEKIEFKDYKNIKEMAKSSLRKDYIFNNDYTLKFFKNINYKNWKNDEIINTSDKYIINFIDNLLNINPKKRFFYY